MEHVHQSWGEKVRRTRRSLALSQEGLAEICGVRQSTISRVERGLHCPSDRVKWLLAGALGVTVEDLFPYPAVRPPFPEPERVAS